MVSITNIQNGALALEKLLRRRGFRTTLTVKYRGGANERKRQRSGSYIALSLKRGRQEAWVYLYTRRDNPLRELNRYHVTAETWGSMKYQALNYINEKFNGY